MRTPSHISAVALAAALITIPQAAQAQLSLGVDLGGGAGGGLGVGVDVGVGDTSVTVDAGVGGSSLVEADVGVSTSTPDSSSGDTSSSGGSSGDLLDVDLGVGGDDNLLDVDADVLDGAVGADVVVAPVNGGGAAVPAPAPVPATPAPAPVSSEPLLGVRLSALGADARIDALSTQLGQANLGDLDLDEAIDDQLVSIVTTTELFGGDRSEIDALIEAGGPGREELLAAIDASVELGSILEREGFASDDVVSLFIGGGGEAEVVVLDAAIDLAQDEAPDAPLLDTELADLDIDVLSDDELAEIDLALLPEEEQRLDAVVRLLGRNSGTPSAGTIGSVDIIDLDALLGEESLAEVDAVLGQDNEDLVLTADLLSALDEEGLSPEAVVAVRTDDEGNAQLFIDLGLGETASEGGTEDPAGDLGENLADLDVDLLTEDELAGIDLALLPQEEQRLDAVIRILGTEPAQGSDGDITGPIEVVELDALLGDESLAELDVLLGNDDGAGDDLLISADLLDALEEEGLSPAAVIGLSNTPDGRTESSSMPAQTTACNSPRSQLTSEEPKQVVAVMACLALVASVAQAAMTVAAPALVGLVATAPALVGPVAQARVAPAPVAPKAMALAAPELEQAARVAALRPEASLPTTAP